MQTVLEPEDILTQLTCDHEVFTCVSCRCPITGKSRDYGFSTPDLHPRYRENVSPQNTQSIGITGLGFRRLSFELAERFIDDLPNLPMPQERMYTT